MADTADNGLAAVEIAHPTKRYLRVVVFRAAQNAAVDSALAQMTGYYEEPVQQPDLVAAEVHQAPAEGTP